MAAQVYFYIYYTHKGPLKWRNARSGALGRVAVAGCTLHSLCWLFSTETSVPLLKKMSFSLFHCVLIVAFLSRITFSHNYHMDTTYLVSDTLQRSRSGSGSMRWSMTKPCELIAASPCHAMSGKGKCQRQSKEQRAQGRSGTVVWGKLIPGDPGA